MNFDKKTRGSKRAEKAVTQLLYPPISISTTIQTMLNIVNKLSQKYTKILKYATLPPYFIKILSKKRKFPNKFTKRNTTEIHKHQETEKKFSLQD